MKAHIPLDKMSVAEKLRALEEIWSDLQRNDRNVPSPAWHADVLKAREARIRSGKSKFSDWTEAKNRIRRRVK